MISSFRKFAKTKFAGLLVFIMIIPFVFWGMGSMFSSGNINSIAKINDRSISTKEFIDYLNNTGIPQDTIRKNLDNNIIEELLSGLISTTLLNFEIEDFNLVISKNTLLKKIKQNKNFVDKNGRFERLKYEKFLLENNKTAPNFEQRLKKRELQKNLFDYIGAGTTSPKFLVNKLYKEENTKLDLDFIDLKHYYKKKDSITNKDLKDFLLDNKDQLKVEHIDFSYVEINPKKLIGVDDFNQSFFDKIDQIEIDISNEVPFKTIVTNLNIIPTNVTNFKFSDDKTKVEKKIFELKSISFDIFENDNSYVLYKINNIEQKEPDLNDEQTKKEIINLVYQKNKFDYNRKLLEKIKNNKFNDNDFLKFKKDLIQSIKLNSIKDNNKFQIEAVKVLYSLPVNSFTLINDEQNNIYLAKIKGYKDEEIKTDNNILTEYTAKQNSMSKNTLLKSYDLFLNKKYDVVVNQKTIERVKNLFQ